MSEQEDKKDLAGETPAQPEKDTTESAPKAAKKPASKVTTAEKKPPSKKAQDTEAQTVAPGKPERTPKTSAEKPDPSEKKAAAKASSKDKPSAEQQESAKEPAVLAPAAAKETEGAEAQTAAPGKTLAEPRTRGAGRSGSGAPARQRVVRAHARHVRTSARKARMVCGHIRGKSVAEARAILAFTPREVARDWSKLLESAVANAENNHELLEDDLVVREAYADEGPTAKRHRPRAMGRASPILKRTSHLTITLISEQ
jgi:ribosomal protein L22